MEIACFLLSCSTSFCSRSSNAWTPSQSVTPSTIAITGHAAIVGRYRRMKVRMNSPCADFGDHGERDSDFTWVWGTSGFCIEVMFWLSRKPRIAQVKRFAVNGNSSLNSFYCEPELVRIITEEKVLLLKNRAGGARTLGFVVRYEHRLFWQCPWLDAYLSRKLLGPSSCLEKRPRVGRQHLDFATAFSVFGIAPLY